MTTSPMTVLDAERARAWLGRADELISLHAEELTALDAAIGDADHGANMARGMAAAVAAVAALGQEEAQTPAAVLKPAALALVSKVGGASGPLYGTFFLRAAGSCGQLPELGAGAIAEAVEAGIGGIVQRGRAQAGEKTMLDAWYPALEALRAHDEPAAAARAAASAAAVGRDATAAMRATKGRASYLGERSVGHVDPGAASTALIVQALADVLDPETTSAPEADRS
ncbi:dihydroxyacetone kinase subunit DhaL [Actinomyces howellii]|uniref:PTS-dependent dihydroxyacetone kinase, ADP-binding subunit dhaL n=1 Tax=Actinomyces howellii TaxID=52771 RepID=A0A3S4UVU7_9ACTO|nr:dihydroxyacetone kinase subunit DhaL [Actinomyces howellii]VEG26092.1 PTS-dependent dihydroxyacetone kinase, ADP-binding subunit dhaL [Actinomyces howellii]